MKVRVRLFARLSELAGRREIEVELGEGLSVGEAYSLLCSQYPNLADYAGSVMYAVNAEYVSPEQPLQDGDELAVIPPVSGGAHAV